MKAIRFAYNPEIIGWIKEAIPVHQRSWNPDKKQWILDDESFDLLRQRYPHTPLVVTAVENNNSDTQEFTLEYIGRPKYAFAQKQVIAFGWNGHKIVIAISIEALQEWFKVGTLYDQLGLKQTASKDEIKSAYWRLARQWHPDVCQEPDAQEQFVKIKTIYELLSNPLKKKKYDLGLRIFGSQQKSNVHPGEALPLRSGVITGKIEYKPNKVLTSITSWKDVIDNQGRTLVSTWKDQTYQMEWVEKERRF